MQKPKNGAAFTAFFAGGIVLFMSAGICAALFGTGRNYAPDIIICAENIKNELLSYIDSLTRGVPADSAAPQNSASTEAAAQSETTPRQAPPAAPLAAQLAPNEYRAVFSRMNAQRRRETIINDRMSGLLARLENEIGQNRYEDAQLTALKIEELAQNQSDGSFNSYLYLARTVLRLTEQHGKSAVDTIKEELARLKSENALYKQGLLNAEALNSLSENALALQESNAQINELLIASLREENRRKEEELVLTRSYLDNGETLKTLEAKENAAKGYTEGIDESRGLLEQSLRIRNREGRIAFLQQARSRYARDIAMVKLIDTLLERL